MPGFPVGGHILGKMWLHLLSSLYFCFGTITLVYSGISLLIKGRLLGQKLVAVLERWLLYRDELCCLEADLGGCNNEVAALQSESYTEIPHVILS